MFTTLWLPANESLTKCDDFNRILIREKFFCQQRIMAINILSEFQDILISCPTGEITNKDSRRSLQLYRLFFAGSQYTVYSLLIPARHLLQQEKREFFCVRHPDAAMTIGPL